MAVTASPESAVRDYLTFLSDPDSLIDAKEVSRLEGEVAAAKDPIDRLLAMGKLHQAKASDAGTYEKVFISEGKAWADAEGIPASAFEQMGVSRDVLQAAGIIVVGGRGRGRVRTPMKPPTALRRQAIKSNDLEAGILTLTEPFSVKDVSDKIGGSAITVKAAIDRLEAQGKITPAGGRAAARGRASKTWTTP
jgi:hypothetical protein